MVVEDDPVTRRLLCRAIEREPSLVLCSAVGTVHEARSYLSQWPIDVLLTDLGLPDGSGISVIRDCRQLRPRADVSRAAGVLEQPPGHRAPALGGPLASGYACRA